MGKRKHIKAGAGDLVPKLDPLTAQVEGESRVKARAAPRGILKKPRVDPEFVPDKTSERILALAAEQRESEEDENELDEDAGSDDGTETKSKQSWRHLLHEDEGVASGVSRSRRRFRSTANSDGDENMEDDEKDDLDASVTAGLSTNVIQMYREIGDYMSRYRSGNIPKAFKSIPALTNWEQILEITHPENYSAASMLHTTRMFAATSSPKVCQRFYQYYLLPRCMDDVMEYRKLNVHLFTALKKAVYKPEAFIKGIVLPWCQSESFTMTCAHVLRAVLTSIKVPVNHAAAAMFKLARLPISGPLSYVLAGMIKKRYTLPSLVIDALIRYFNSYDADEPMQLSLNGCIEVLVEFYHHEFTDEQKQSLIKLLENNGHSLAREPILKLLRGEAET